MLTHEQIVDLAWSDQIQPLLKHRFPKATEEELKEAHAYAYGGCIIQDLGYYPFGNKDFSNLCCRGEERSHGARAWPEVIA